MAACASYYRMKPLGLRRAASVLGLFLTSVMILAKVVPWIPGHFTWHEWLALGIWTGLGVAIRASRQQHPEGEPTMEMADAAG